MKRMSAPCSKLGSSLVSLCRRTSIAGLPGVSALWVGAALASPSYACACEGAPPPQGWSQWLYLVLGIVMGLGMLVYSVGLAVKVWRSRPC